MTGRANFCSDQATSSILQVSISPEGGSFRPLHFPSWLEVCGMLTSMTQLYPSWAMELANRKSGYPQFQRARALVRLICKWTNHPGYDQAVQSTAPELGLILAHLVEASRRHATEVAPNRSSVVLTNHLREFHQLPCTEGSALRKACRIQTLAGPTDPILLLGDDDLVGLQLEKMGYSHVTVVDIDERVLAMYGRSSRVAVFKHDLRMALPSNLQSAYRVVAFDPPYLHQWFKIFLEAAYFAARKDQTASLFCSLNLSILFPHGLDRLRSCTESLGLKLQQIVLCDSLYKMSMLGWLCMTATAKIFGTIASQKRWEAFKSHVPKHFASDTLIFSLAAAPGSLTTSP